MARGLLRLEDVRTWLIVLAATAALGAGTASAGPRVAASSGRMERGDRVAQVPTPVDLAIAAVTRAQRIHATLVAERVAATRRYDAELAEIDQLKRQKASWRRDRALRGKLASSLETAKVLTALADKVRKAELEVARAKAAAIVVIDAAMASATPARKAELARRRAAWAPPRPARKIVIPDGTLDLLADPEELDEQAAALAETEAALAAEVSRLDQRAARFDAQVELRRQHERAESMARQDDEYVTRVAVRGGTETAAESDQPNQSAPPAEDGGMFDSPGNRDVATVLSDVVDAATVDVLRSSDRSSDPRTWAAASRQARAAVADRLQKLRKQRAAIEARARELRTP